MKNLLLSLSLIAAGLCSFGQSTEIEDALMVRTKTCADEVYKNCNQYATDYFLLKYAAILSRIEIKTEAFTEGESYRLLSQAGLKNKCNPDMVRDNNLTFDPDNFNPLKYFLKFTGTEDVIYRVDHTDYIIVIHPG